MDIKQRIGARIKATRKEVGLTVREVAEKTGSLKQARISNWEQGLRTPGPSETLLLADALDVSAAYLLCLTDQKEISDKADNLVTLVPIYNTEQVASLDKLDALDLLNYPRIPVEKQVAKNLSERAFAYRIEDNSMSPEYSLDDSVIVDPAKIPRPSQVALIVADGRVMIRKVRDKGKQGIDFVPLNQDWPVITISTIEDADVLGLVVEHRRYIP